MTAAARYAREFAGQRALYAPRPVAEIPKLAEPRPAHHLLADIEAGAQSLAELVSRWSPMLPKGGELVSAEALVTGLRRSLAELHAHMGGSHDAS